MNPAILYICYSRVTDPLIESQVIAYLRGLATRGVCVHLMTFERGELAKADEQAIRDHLAAAGIAWHPFRHHTSSGLFAKVRDAARGALAAARLCVRHRVRLIHARSHLAAAVGLLLKWRLGCRLLFDIRGLLAEEYVDVGHWRRGGIRFRLTKAAEKVLLRRADGFVVLTQRLRDELARSYPRLRENRLAVIPCCVDTRHYSISASDRESYRLAQGWGGRIVLTYVGKLGTWYLPEELAAFFAVAHRIEPRFYFAVYTQSDPEVLRRALETSGVPADAYSIGFAPPDQLPLTLVACDAGVSFIKPCPSKRASSPTKLGEYLAAGLPVVANVGIGDCDQLLEKHEVGVVLCDFTPKGYEEAACRLRDLVTDPDTRRRCCSCADQELSLRKVGVPRYARLYEHMIGTQLRPEIPHAPDVTETQLGVGLES